ncbi:16S rRNA (guanine(527)-N(7))-methyltransferase RsmG [Oscillibacter sp.]|uniref:16S rRNA (guanine(527)-N(7))-methyltransferase RsmG n=1 Tax=Oscillibacter sp. TaxID=1945593 RepID=UPI002D7F90F1|nr:16S rRNA (guanine(527)-N(7))-methyltransferase RsmG [Oscillibacter sp.]
MMEAILRQGLAALSLPTESVPALLRYWELLAEKNKVMNLTAITDPEDAARLHFLDSAALLTLADLRGKSVVDVGTGAGFPGLPLKILEPSIHLTLLDAQRKRVDFLREVCEDLGLEGTECVHGRAEEFAGARREFFDFAVSRAVAALPVLAELCLPLVKPGGRFLAMKSVDTDGELSAAGRAVHLLGGRLEKPVDYNISGTNVPRRLVIMTKITETQKKYPRTFAKIKKNPL